MTKLTDETRNFLEKIKGKKLVFTNGCFDIIHSGHVAYLNEAKSQVQTCTMFFPTGSS